MLGREVVGYRGPIASRGGCVAEKSETAEKDQPSGRDLERRRRIRRGIELYHIDAKHAQETMERFDRKRARFYEYYTDRKWGALSNYDMMINTSRMGIDQCVRFLATAARAMMETDD